MAGKKFSVAVEITALDRATKTINAVGKATKSLVTDPIGKIGAGLARAGAVASLAAGAAGAIGGKLMANLLDQAGALKDFSGQIDWNVESLQRWRRAAKMAGVNNDLFDASIEKMTNTMGEFKRKSGPLYDLLQKRGEIAFIKQLKKAGGAEALDLLIGKLEMIPKAEDRSNLARAAFGKSGADMIRLAVEGRESLGKMRAEADRLGLVLGKDSVDAAEAFGDKLDTLKDAAAGVGNRLAAAAIPAIDRLVDRSLAWIEANKGLIDSKIIQFADGFADSLGRASDWWDDHGSDVLDGLGRGLDTVSGFCSNVADNIGAITTAIEVLAGTWLAGQLVQQFDATWTAIAKNPRFAAVMAALTALGLFVSASETIAGDLEGKAREDIGNEIAQRSTGRPGVFRSQAEAKRYMDEQQRRLASRDDTPYQTFGPEIPGSLIERNPNLPADRAPQGKIDVNLSFQQLPYGTRIKTEKKGAAVGDVRTGVRFQEEL